MDPFGNHSRGSSSYRSNRGDLVASLEETFSLRPESSPISGGGSRLSRLTRLFSGASRSTSSASSTTQRPKSNFASRRLVNTSGDKRITGAIDALDLVAEASPTFWSTLNDVGDKPVFVNVMSRAQLPTGAQVYLKNREISVSDDCLHDPDKLISSIASELENLKRFPDLAAIKQRVRQGEIQSASQYAVGV